MAPGWIEDSAKWLADGFIWWTNLFTTALQTVEIAVLNVLVEGLGGKVVHSSPMIYIYVPKDPNKPGFAEGIIGSGIQYGINTLPQVAGNLAKGLVGLSESVSTTVKPTFVKLGTDLTSLLTTALSAGSPPEEVDAAVKAFVEAFQKRIEETISEYAKSPMKPEDAMPAGMKILGAITVANVIGNVAGMAWDASHPVKKWGTQELFTSVMLNLTSSALTSPILQMQIQAGIIRPLGYAMNQKYRPALPSTGQADQMLFEGHISRERWKQIYAYNGWTDEDAENWYSTMFREPNQRTLLSMLSDPIIEESWVRMKLKELGLFEDDINVMIAYKRRLIGAQTISPLQDDISRLRTTAVTDYVGGWLTEDGLRKRLKPLGFDSDEIGYIVIDAKARGDRERREDLRDAAITLYREDKLTEVELKIKLRSLGMQDDRVNAIVNREMAKKGKIPVRET